MAGCTDSTACNYNEAATDEDGSCAYGDFGYDCDGDCLSDVDGDGICDPFEVEGCLNPLACNYNADATDANNALCDFSRAPAARTQRLAITILKRPTKTARAHTLKTGLIAMAIAWVRGWTANAAQRPQPAVRTRQHVITPVIQDAW